MGLPRTVKLPSMPQRSVSAALNDTSSTRLGRAVAPMAVAHPGLTGIHALSAPRDAFAARMLLAAAAERSLDVQYYIWHGDQTGTLLFEALRAAAERGVRVRLLLDDNNTAGLDETLAALTAHPNLEVRLYNPALHRRFRALNFLTDFNRANRRMHNKSFTADNQATIVGGRNVGNEYFGAGDATVFADLDVLAVGQAVPEVSKQFDTYWQSASAYPLTTLVPAGPDAAAKLQQRFAATRADPASRVYLEAVHGTPLLRDLLEGDLTFDWVPAQVMYDDPAKTLGKSAPTALLLPHLLQAMDKPQTGFDLVSPYFVPGDQGTEILTRLAQRGIQVRILTNSLAATDVSAVHAGYAKRRETLLLAGVRLYEFKPSAIGPSRSDTPSFGGSSSASLHAKTFALDRNRMFVGSFNFDPRSELLNTEMGVVFRSPRLAQQLAQAFEQGIQRAAYEVRLAPDRRSLQWLDRSATDEILHDTEPQTSWLKRAGVGAMSRLPIEWLL
jgi:putative cardiolipin synthase